MKAASNMSLLWFGKAYKTTWQYGIICDQQRMGSEADCLFFCIWVSQGPPNSGPNREHRELYPEEGVETGGVLAVTCFGLKIKELPSLIAMDIFRALFIDDLAICFRGRSLDITERHLHEAVNAIQGLCASKTPEAMPAGVLTPGRFKHAGQALW